MKVVRALLANMPASLASCGVKPTHWNRNNSGLMGGAIQRRNDGELPVTEISGDVFVDITITDDVVIKTDGPYVRL